MNNPQDNVPKVDKTNEILMKHTAIIQVEFKDHDKTVLTNSNGDTYTSKSEELMDFLHDIDDSNDISQMQPDWVSMEEQIKQSYGIDFEFFKPYIDFKTGIAKVPSKVDRSKLNRSQHKIWIDIEAPNDCQFYECFKPHNLNIKAQPKTVERLLVELQDELHYQTYPSDNPVPIYKEGELKHDYFPLHMVKTVSDRYSKSLKSSIAELEAEIKAKDKEIMTEYQKYSGHVNFLKDKIAELEAKNKEYREALEEINEVGCDSRLPSAPKTLKINQIAEQALKPKDNV